MCQANFQCFCITEFILVYYPSFPPGVGHKCNQVLIILDFSSKGSVFFLEWPRTFQLWGGVYLADSEGYHPVSSGYWLHPDAFEAHDLGPYSPQFPGQRPWLSLCAARENMLLLQMFTRPLYGGSSWLSNWEEETLIEHLPALHCLVSRSIWEGVSSWLLIGAESPTHCGWSIPGQVSEVGLCQKGSWTWAKSKLVVSILPWSLFYFLPPGSCLEILPSLPLVTNHNL